MSESSVVRVRTSEEIEVGSPDGLTEAKINQNDAAISTLVNLAESTLSPKDMLKKYAALGGAFIKHARWQKSQFPAWEKQDYDRLSVRIETEVKFRLPIKDVRMDVYARVHAFVEAVRPVAPGIDKVSYFQVANKFLPMLHWDKVDLEGEIKKEWATFVRETIERQGSDSPFTMKELDAAIEGHKTALKREADARRDPEKAAIAEQRAENAAIVAKRQASITKVSKALSDAIEAGHIDGKDIADTVASVAAAFKVDIPAKTVNVPTGFDPATASIEDCRTMLAALFHYGKISEIKVIADVSTQMVDSFKATVKLSA